MKNGTKGKRYFRVVAYGLFSLAGLGMVVWPSPAVERATSPTSGLLIYVWAGVFLLAGTSAFIGSVTGRWLGEYVGLPALASVFLVYGLAALGSGSAMALAAGCALSAVAFVLLALWHDVEVVRREAVRGLSKGGA